MGVSTSLTQRCQSLFLVLKLLPHSNYIVDLLPGSSFSLCVEEATSSVF